MCVILFHLYITMYLHLHTTYIYQLFWIFEHIISLVSFAAIISELKAFLSRHDLGSYIKWKIEKYIAKIPIFSYQTLDSAPLIDNGWWFSNCNNLWLKPMETLLKFAAAAIVQIRGESFVKSWMLPLCCWLAVAGMKTILRCFFARDWQVWELAAIHEPKQSVKVYEISSSLDTIRIS